MIISTLLFLCLTQSSAVAASFASSSATLTNPYLPWGLGLRFNFLGYGDATGIGFFFETLAIETVDGVQCLKVRSKRSIDDEQLFWIAQDTEGNVWQLRDYDGFAGEFDDSDVLYMPASPLLGASYQLFDPPDIGLMHTVTSLTTTVNTPLANYSDCLQVQRNEFGETENVFFALGVGAVKLDFVGSENGGWSLQNIVGNGLNLSFPAIVVQPTNQVVTEGESVTFAARAAGPPPLSYQWQRNGANIPGAVSLAYTIESAAAGGDYVVVVANNQGAITSRVATLTVNTRPTPTPFLEFEITERVLVLRWSASLSHRLESSPTIPSNSSWTPHQPPPVIEGDRKRVNVSPISDKRFFRLGPNAPPPTVYDLKTDWTDLTNPNGPWSLNHGASALPHVDWWQRDRSSTTTAQPAWARFESGTSRLPVWMLSVGTETFPHDWEAGDIIVHTTDSANGVGSGLANVTWTSPVTGTVSVEGNVWPGREGRANDWNLYLNGVLLARGSLFTGDPYDSAHPFAFDSGLLPGKTLSGLSVVQGAILKLEIVNMSGFGDFVGVNLKITAQAGI